MGTDLVATASRYLTSDTMDRIATALGADRGGVGRATQAAIPTLLSGLAGLASSRDGATKIDALLRENGAGSLDSLRSAIGSGGGSIKESGIRSLSTLFGSSSVSALGGAVGRFSGLGQSSGSSLIAMLAPLVLGLLGREKAEKGLDASGLAGLLGEQRDSIAAAMPSDFKDMLQSTGLDRLAGLGERAQGMARAGRDTMHSMAQTASRGVASGGTAGPVAGGGARAAHVPNRTPARARRPGWLTWGLPVLAIMALAAWFFSTQAPDRAEVGPPVSARQLNTTLGTTGDQVTSALGSIRDEASARQAVSKLNAAQVELDRILTASKQLAPEGQKALAASARDVLPRIEQLAQQAAAVPGAQAVAGKQIEAVRSRFETLGRAGAG